jgi:hypothetical protein
MGVFLPSNQVIGKNRECLPLNVDGARERNQCRSGAPKSKEPTKPERGERGGSQGKSGFGGAQNLCLRYQPDAALDMPEHDYRPWMVKS